MAAQRIKQTHGVICFSTWFAGFTRHMRRSHGVSVTLRDSNVLLYRSLYERGHSPEAAAALMK